MDLGATVCTRAFTRLRALSARFELRGACAPGAWRPNPRPGARARTPCARWSCCMLLPARGQDPLEQRPLPGSGAGLWSLPEMPAGGAVQVHCAGQLGLRGRARRRSRCGRCATCSPIFTLDIRALRCEVRRLGAHAAQPGAHGFTLERARDAGVPAPVKRLLAPFASSPAARRSVESPLFQKPLQEYPGARGCRSVRAVFCLAARGTGRISARRITHPGRIAEFVRFAKDREVLFGGCHLQQPRQ